MDATYSTGRDDRVQDIYTEEEAEEDAAAKVPDRWWTSETDVRCNIIDGRIFFSNLCYLSNKDAHMKSKNIRWMYFFIYC